MQNETDKEDPSIVDSVKGSEIWIPSGDNMFLLEYLGGLQTYDRYLPIAEKMIDSFKFLDEGTPRGDENQANQPGFSFVKLSGSDQ